MDLKIPPTFVPRANLTIFLGQIYLNYLGFIGLAPGPNATNLFVDVTNKLECLSFTPVL